MNFWKNCDLNYQSLTQLSDRELITLVNGMNRKAIIEWLTWNDPNGIYQDDQSLSELGNIMSRDEGIEILLRQVIENRVIS